MNNKWAENSSSWQGKRNILLNCQFELLLTERPALAWPRLTQSPDPRQELSTAVLATQGAEFQGLNQGERFLKPQITKWIHTELKTASLGGDIFVAGGMY